VCDYNIKYQKMSGGWVKTQHLCFDSPTRYLLIFDIINIWFNLICRLNSGFDVMKLHTKCTSCLLFNGSIWNFMKQLHRHSNISIFVHYWRANFKTVSKWCTVLKLKWLTMLLKQWFLGNLLHENYCLLVCDIIYSGRTCFLIWWT